MTAVEWFFRWFNDNPEATHKDLAEAFEQAKAMEKEQIIEIVEKSRATGLTAEYLILTYKGGEQ